MFGYKKLASNASAAPSPSSSYQLGPVRRAVELWIYDDKRRFLCAWPSVSRDGQPPRWQACFNRTVGERGSFLESCWSLAAEILGFKPKPTAFVELHTRLNAAADTLVRVYLLKLSLKSLSLPPPPGFKKLAWKDLSAVELGLKNREFSHPIDYRVVEFLKNP